MQCKQRKRIVRRSMRQGDSPSTSKDCRQYNQHTAAKQAINTHLDPSCLYCAEKPATPEPLHIFQHQINQICCSLKQPVNSSIMSQVLTLVLKNTNCDAASFCMLLCSSKELHDTLLPAAAKGRLCVSLSSDSLVVTDSNRLTYHASGFLRWLQRHFALDTIHSIELKQESPGHSSWDVFKFLLKGLVRTAVKVSISEAEVTMLPTQGVLCQVLQTI